MIGVNVSELFRRVVWHGVSIWSWTMRSRRSTQAPTKDLPVETLDDVAAIIRDGKQDLTTRFDTSDGQDEALESFRDEPTMPGSRSRADTLEMSVDEIHAALSV